MSHDPTPPRTPSRWLPGPGVAGVGVGAVLVALAAAVGAAGRPPVLAQAPGPAPGPDAAAYGGYAGAGLVIGGILTAVATGFFQPWLRERNTQARLAQAEKDREELRAKVTDLEKRVNDYDQTERGLTDRLTTLTQQLAEATQKIVRLANDLLVVIRRQQADAPVPEILVGGPPGPPTGPRVLLVEDQPEARTALTFLLERAANCRVEAVTNGPEALDALGREPPPDCAVVDLMLPGCSGEDVIREVARRKLPTAVIVVTAVTDEGRLRAARDLNPRAVLIKPVNVARDLIPLLKPAAAAGGH